MAAPNIVNVATITGKTVGLAVTTSATAIITGGANKVTKVNALYVSNIDGVGNADITVTFYNADNTTSYHVAKTVTVPADATIDVLTKAIYLEEGDELRLAANADSDIEAVASYEEIS